MYADQPTQNLHRYMLANYYQFGSDVKQAAHWYGQITPGADSLYVYSGYIPLLAATQSYDQIVQLIPQLDEPFKKNQEMQLLFATALEAVGKKNEAHARLITLNENNKTNQELAFKVAQMYLERSEPENALKVIDNLLNNVARRPNNYIFHFMKSQIYVQLNRKAEALTAIKQCIETYPRFDKSWLMYAVLQEQEGRLEEAIKGYSTFLETTSDPKGEIQRHLMALNLRQKLSKGTKQTQKHEQTLDEALAHFEQKEFAKAHTSVDKYLAQTPGDVQARLLKIQILAAQNQFDAAANQLAEWIMHDADQEIWLKTLHLLTYIGMPYKTALQALHQIEKNKGPSALLALYQSDLALRDNNQKAAHDALKKAYKLSHDAPTKTKIAYQLAVLHYENTNWKQAQNLLEEAHKLGAAYAPSENLLAYIYATKGNNIKRAHEHIARALQADPANPHFLDTKALVLYKEKNYDDALALWQKVAQSCPTDFTILCHLGKCHFAKGNQQLAIQSIKSAAVIAKNDQQKTKADELLTRWHK